MEEEPKFLVYKEKSLQPSTEVQEKIKAPQIWINDESWQNLELSSISQNIIQWRVNSLFLNDNQNRLLCCQISHIKFAHLTSLTLNGNNIQSVEALSLMYLPNLESLLLGNNKLVRVDCLRKMDSPSLLQLQLSTNCINQMARLSELSSKKLRTLNLEQHFFCDQTTCDAAWPAKLQTTKLNSIWIRSQNRIHQKKCEKKLKKKCKGMAIYNAL